jgi:hypothetical protein
MALACAHQAYTISKGTLKLANKKFSKVDNDYEISLTNASIVEPASEESFPSLLGRFAPLSHIAQREANDNISTIGAWLWVMRAVSSSHGVG